MLSEDPAEESVLNLGDPPKMHPCLSRISAGIALAIALVTTIFSSVCNFAHGSEVKPATNKPSKVIIDSQNRMLVNGSLFYSFGLYLGPTEDEHLARIAEAGFNTVLSYGYGRDAKNPRAFLDRALKHRLWVIYSLKDHYTDRRGFPKDRFSDGATMARIEHVRPLKDHPALLAWYINDERVLNRESQAQLKAMHEMLKQEDPAHPTLSVINRPNNAAAYYHLTDIIAPDPYPVPNYPLTMVTDWIDLVQKGMRYSKPVWNVSQIFALGIYDAAKQPLNIHMQEPTFDQKRCIAYLSLIQGVQGLLFYSYTDLWRRPGRKNEDSMLFERRWAEVRSIGHELRQLLPILLEGKPWTATPTPRDVNIMARGLAFGEQLYLMVANASGARESLQVSFELPRGGTWFVKRLFEGNVIAEVKEQRVSVYIPPYGSDTIVFERSN